MTPITSKSLSVMHDFMTSSNFYWLSPSLPEQTAAYFGQTETPQMRETCGDQVLPAIRGKISKQEKTTKILLARPISPKCMQRKTSFLQRFCHLLAARVSTEAPYVANDGWRRTNWVGLGQWQHHFFTFLGAKKLWICNILWNQHSVREHLFLISRTPQ